MWIARAFRAWRKRRQCFHHDRRRRESWIRDRIHDYRKLYWCTECGRTWIL